MCPVNVAQYKKYLSCENVNSLQGLIDRGWGISCRGSTWSSHGSGDGDRGGDQLHHLVAFWSKNRTLVKTKAI